MTRFAHPWMFLLIIIPVLAQLFLRMRRKYSTISYPSLQSLGEKHSLMENAVLVLPVIIFLGFSLIIAALARPQKIADPRDEVRQGIAIQLVVDRSSSMNQPIQYEDEEVPSIDAVKRVLKQFVLERRNDLLGLISFARYADTLYPLSLNETILTDFIDTLKTAATREEDGTSIGDALALGAARLQQIEEESSKTGYELQSKIIILLTDGENNAGSMSPGEAADLAAEWGIKVYTIAMGGPVYAQTILGTRMIAETRADVETLKQIADTTGGAYFQAENGEALEEIYRSIDALEQTKITGEKKQLYEEQFVFYLLAGMALLIIANILQNTVFRMVP